MADNVTLGPLNTANAQRTSSDKSLAIKQVEEELIAVLSSPLSERDDFDRSLLPPGSIKNGEAGQTVYQTPFPDVGRDTARQTRKGSPGHKPQQQPPEGGNRTIKSG